MPKFLCLQRALPSTDMGKAAPKKPSPAEMQAMYEQFNAWRSRFQSNIVDLGGRLGKGKVVADPMPDGPFVEVKELVGGYMIIEAKDVDEAANIARACPGLVTAGSGVEVIEIHTPGG